MSLRHHEIAEANHRILNPFTDEKLRLLGEVARVGPGTRILDLACGKGEMLCRWAEWFGSGGVGVDLSHVFLAAARARAAELGVADRVKFVQGDAGAYEAEPGAFDIASCLGATWIGGGLAGTMALLRPAIRDGGLILVGEPYWIEEPPAEALAAWGRAGRLRVARRDAERLDAAGLELVEMVLADHDSWDRYEAAVADDRRLARREPGRPGPRRDARDPGRGPAHVPALGAPVPRLGRVRHRPR